ncbi:hypothetical protein [Bacillus sp. ISL-37]|uniref:hypothetical protein n=1 Tax=Bacillus sp. ISL-37 TaxID=2819123 RepID=UPI001BEA7F99|nr:hypothetical protein [Bacillus sp. ISL-37]MBT2686545.1 hypothetical protein [Bacillus sp. ISL-37]
MKQGVKRKKFFYFLAAGTIVSAPLMWNEFVLPSLIGCFYLICIGVVSLIGQIVLTSAFTHENIIVVEVVRYIGIFFNIMWGLSYGVRQQVFYLSWVVH